MKKIAEEGVAMRLRNRRMELGLNKSQLARQAGINHSVITRIESGEYKHSRHLFPIADVLGVSVDWLVRGRDPGSDPGSGAPGQRGLQPEGPSVHRIGPPEIV